MSVEDIDNVKVKVGEKGQEEFVSLGDLAGISLDDVKEQRGFAFPKGDYEWEISVDAENLPRLAPIGEGDKAKAGIIVPCKCIDVVRVKDDEFSEDPNSLIGKYHRETFFLSGDVAVALGYFKAFAKDTGANVSGDLKSIIGSLPGVRFSAPITKRKDKNDSDIVYTSMDRSKIKPRGQAEVSSVAVATAA